MATSMIGDVPEDPDAYYVLLNVPKDASNEEINNAYRRLGRIYHPDKHVDLNKKAKAEVMFNKIQKAKQVLLDPHTRAIYDTVGIKGLEEIEGKEIVPVYGKSPKEIREEYERIVKDREERRAQQSTNPRGTISVGLDATDVFDRYEAGDFRSGLPHIEINSMSISQSVEAPLTHKDTAVLAGSLSTQNGTGAGTIVATLRRVLSVKSWAEVEVAAGNGAAVSLKGFRTLTRRTFGTMSGSLQFTPHGVLRPAFTSMVACQLDRNIQGRLTWSLGAVSFMSSSLIWDTQFDHLGLTLQMGMPNSFISLNYAHKFIEDEAKFKASARLGTFAAYVECGFEKKISRFSLLGASLAVGAPMGVLLKIKLNRGSQNFLFPIHLSDDIVPGAIFYGTVVPLATYYILKVFVVTPFLREQKDRDLEKRKEEGKETLRRRKREAEAELELMRESSEKSRRSEEEKGGVVIVKAVYGKLVMDDLGCSDGNIEKLVDVRDAVQLQVKDSTIKIPAGSSKSCLPGFYDPCLGEEKSLYIRYRFRGSLHEVTVPDEDAVRLPRQEHLIQNT